MNLLLLLLPGSAYVTGGGLTVLEVVLLCVDGTVLLHFLVLFALGVLEITQKLRALTLADVQADPSVLLHALVSFRIGAGKSSLVLIRDGVSTEARCSRERRDADSDASSTCTAAGSSAPSLYPVPHLPGSALATPRTLGTPRAHGDKHVSFMGDESADVAGSPRPGPGAGPPGGGPEEPPAVGITFRVHIANPPPLPPPPPPPEPQAAAVAGGGGAVQAPALVQLVIAPPPPAGAPLMEAPTGPVSTPAGSAADVDADGTMGPGAMQAVGDVPPVPGGAGERR